MKHHKLLLAYLAVALLLAGAPLRTHSQPWQMVPSGIPGAFPSSSSSSVSRATGLGELADSSGKEWLFESHAWVRIEPEETLTLPLPGVERSVVQRPLYFERNDGQTAAEVAFLSRGRGYTLFLANNETVLKLVEPPSRNADFPVDPHASRGCNADFPVGETGRLGNRRYDIGTDDPAAGARGTNSLAKVLRMRLSGANPQPAIEGEQSLRAKANYFIGNQPSLWRTNILTFGKVRYKEVYPGIDLVYYGNEGQLEYDFVVAPGAQPNQIAMEFDGADGLRIQEDGALVLNVGGREVSWQRPVIYQEIDGKRIEIAGWYRVRHAPAQPADLAGAAHSAPSTKLVSSVRFVSFELAAYDPRLPLVIDPILVYSTYLGGSEDDAGHAVAVDGKGNVFVSGLTASTDFPTRSPLNNQNAGGFHDVYVAKFSPAGELIFSTYLGGTGDDGGITGDPLRIALSPSGECFVVGGTASGDFPLMNPVQEWFGGGAGDVFVTGVKPDGAALTFSTYLGGSLGDGARNITFGPGGDIYVVGSTFSADFPVVNAFQPEKSSGADEGDRDAFITRLEAGGKRIIYSTYLGASSTKEWATDIAVDDRGNAYPALWVAHSTMDRYQWLIAKLSPDGSSRLFERRWPSVMADSKYVGHRPFIALAPNDTVVLAGHAWGLPLPAANKPNPFTNPTLSMGTAAGYPDVYLALFSATNGSYISAVYFGGDGSENPSALCVDPEGGIILTGTTAGPVYAPSHFPVLDAMESGPNPGTSEDVFVAKFRSSDLRLTFSTLFGGTGDEGAADTALDSRGNLAIVGSTSLWRTNAQLPTLNAFQPQPGVGTDAFLVKLSLRESRLQISRTGQRVTLSWPAEVTGFVLESADSPFASQWKTVPEPAVLEDDQHVVAIDAGGGSKFFRLRKP